MLPHTHTFDENGNPKKVPKMLPVELPKNSKLGQVGNPLDKEVELDQTIDGKYIKETDKS